MKKILNLIIAVATMLGINSAFAAQTYTDPAGGNISTAGVADILSTEVSHTSTDLVFKVTVNGNTTNDSWAKYLIGISTGSSPGTTSNNGWQRPISLSSPVGGMNYWIGSWANSGAGVELYQHNVTSGFSLQGASYTDNFPGSLAFSSGTQSLLTFTVSRAALGLTGDSTFYFDIYSSGGNDWDSAIDSLANPNQTITAWGSSATPTQYTSNTTSGILSYAIPEPSTPLLMGLGLAGLAVLRRTRKNA